MVLFGGALGLLAIAVWIFCIIDVITTPAGRVRNLPKLAWFVLVVLLVDLGSIAWLVAGRPWNSRVTVPPAEREGAWSPVHRQSAGRSRPMSPDDDEEFLATLKNRAEEQRRRHQADEDPPGEPPA